MGVQGMGMGQQAMGQYQNYTPQMPYPMGGAGAGEQYSGYPGMQGMYPGADMEYAAAYGTLRSCKLLPSVPLPTTSSEMPRMCPEMFCVVPHSDSVILTGAHPMCSMPSFRSVKALSLLRCFIAANCILK